jgi:hypothetical protein
MFPVGHSSFLPEYWEKIITQHCFTCHYAPIYPGILKTNENIPKVMNYIGA